MWHYRRKFRSQTSDNMDRWKSRGEKSPGGEEKKWEDQRRERERRKKMQVHEKVGKSRFTVFFPWFGALEGRKVGSLKRRVRSQLARWEKKNCTPLWREAHFQVKMDNTLQLRSTCRSWDVEKGYAVVARSTFPSVLARSTFSSQNVQRTPFSDHFGTCDVEKVHAVVAQSTFPSQKCKKLTVPDHFWKLRCSKSARRSGAKRVFKSKCTKDIKGHHSLLGPLWNLRCRKSARRCGAKHISKSKV